MLDPTELYELAGSLPAGALESLERPVLVQAMTGFVDAGQRPGSPASS